ncbi:hypothetical protein [Roseovarius phycicola]|uniref:NADH dehydrogenase n=1 Tax=Roseovarius phycicola TaxID=3080976 RepID=A0ABZ2HGH3_9RHOB
MALTKIKVVLATSGALALAGCAVPPQGTTAQDVTSFEAAVASIGCVLHTEADYLPVELQTGLTREQTQSMAAYVLTAKRAVRLENGGVKLTTGACA